MRTRARAATRHHAINSANPAELSPKPMAVDESPRPDDRTIMFKADTVYTVNGDGIDVNGNGAGFGVAQIVETGIGCTEPRSIVQVPGGVMFRSSATRSGISLSAPTGS